MSSIRDVSQALPDCSGALNAAKHTAGFTAALQAKLEGNQIAPRSLSWQTTLRQECAFKKESYVWGAQRAEVLLRHMSLLVDGDGLQTKNIEGQTTDNLSFLWTNLVKPDLAKCVRFRIFCLAMCPAFTVVTAGEQERWLHLWDLFGHWKVQYVYNTRNGTMACAKRHHQLLYRAAIVLRHVLCFGYSMCFQCNNATNPDTDCSCL